MEPPVSSPAADGGSETPSQKTAGSTSTDVASDVTWKQTFLEVLRWCLPALLIGFAIRAAVMWCMPYGYVQYDSSDYLVTTQRFLEDHHFYVHHKRSYLTPSLFTAAFFLPAPATITIAVAQHLMGLIATLIVGALVRFWFRFWRYAIIPVTVLFGANPSIIWYEHTIMGEAQFLFFTLVMLLAGTLLALRPNIPRLIGFIVSLVLVFGTRLESKTFLLFAGLLVLFAFWKQWWRMAVAVAAIAITFQVAFHVGGDRDPSSLVYASLIRFAPTQSAAVPDIMPGILPIREKARERSMEFPTQLVRVSKDINIVVGDYVAARFQGRKKQAPEEARIVQNLCLETLKAEPVKTVVEPWIKFRLAIDAWSAYSWDKRSLWENQRDAMTSKDWMTTVLGHGLTGQPITLQQIPDWLKQHYHASSVDWFSRYQKNWNKDLIHFRTPDRHLNETRWVHDFYGGVADAHHTLPGVPFYYILGFLGMFVAMVRPSQLRGFHIAWVLTALGGLYVSCMIGVTNGRFRFVYEPFFLIYFFFLFDCAADLWKTLRDRRVTSRACST